MFLTDLDLIRVHKMELVAIFNLITKENDRTGQQRQSVINSVKNRAKDDGLHELNKET